MKHLAVLTATHSDGYSFNNNMTSVSGAHAGPSLHGNVNILLSGAMLSALILVVFLLCYCCHRNTNKNLQYWQEQPEVFTVDEQCYEVSGVFRPQEPCTTTASGPPPDYEVVTANRSQKNEDMDESGLPTYAAAMRLEAQGYV